MSGGSGTRLWPASRAATPKQFLPLVGAHSLFAETLARVADYAPPIIVANAGHHALVRAAVGEREAQVLLEPVGRNTAATLAVAALVAEADELLLALPADHLIADKAAFDALVAEASPAARDGALVAFGIVPTSPETGYGYIKSGAAHPQGGFAIARFTEKPDRARAEAWLAEGGHHWNSGMFLFTAGAMLAEMERHCPDILAGCRAALAGAEAQDGARVLGADFEAVAAQPVDVAVMEKTEKGVVFPADMGWSDVGSWEALWEVASRDAQGNAVRGNAVLADAEGNLVHADGRLVVLAGVHNLVVVETADAVLVMPRAESQRVRDVVAELDEDMR